MYGEAVVVEAVLSDYVSRSPKCVPDILTSRVTPYANDEMAILRCNQCGFLQEESENLAGETLPCPSCKSPTPVYRTKFFVGKLIEKYFDAQRTIARLTKQLLPESDLAQAPLGASQFDGIDLSNTNLLASEMQHKPICDWFASKQIKVKSNIHGVDTTGFFDEVAVSIGANLCVLNEVIDRIRWAQNKEYSSTTIRLEKRSTEDAKAIVDFCQQLYELSFVGKCFHKRKENLVHLVVQTVPAIRGFFAGEWLEWYALMACLERVRKDSRRFSVARNLAITFQNGDSFELDVFLLIGDKVPVCIECKTGEFRQNLEKYQILRKRLGVNERDFVMCVAGLGEEHSKGLSAMYGLSFTNEIGLKSVVNQICQQER